jgi:triacylglycerol lipase
MKKKIQSFISTAGTKITGHGRVTGAIQGVFGDKLPKRFQTEMAFYSEGKPHAATGLRKKHVCIFVHGSSDTEMGWNVKAPHLNFGQNLILEFGVEVLYVRYNSGLAVSDNGEKLAALIAALLTINPAVKNLTLIGHSMGGLVIHSAIYHARAQERKWLQALRQVFLLGTPHAGAPLAKLAEKTEQIIQFIPNPITLIAASVIGLRSKGLKDLSQGQTGLPAEGKILMPDVKYIFVAGGVAKRPGGMVNRLFGDGMVRSPSAHPEPLRQENWLSKAVPWLGKSRKIEVVTLHGIGHLALRTSPEAYRAIAGHFSP